RIVRDPQVVLKPSGGGWLVARRELASALLLFGAIIAAYIPTYMTLAAGPWQTEQEGHGPLIMLAAAWVAWQSRGRLHEVAFKPAPIAGWAGLIVGLVFMVVGRSQDILAVEVGSQIPVLAGAILLLYGWAVLRVFAFPIAFLAFAVPPPSFLVDALTVPLKAKISDWVANALYSAGYPIAQNGVLIMIGQYQLLVKDACAGMNSIFTLSAIGILYVYLAGHSLIRNVLLLAATLPIAVAANVVRVAALVLIAYYGGIGAIEGAYHELTGMALFVVAFLLLFLLDAAIGAAFALSGGMRRLFVGSHRQPTVPRNIGSG
ncbi:MAG TPA: exosortase, partial [Steroidobacteraceae bacterium]